VGNEPARFDPQRQPGVVPEKQLEAKKAKHPEGEKRFAWNKKTQLREVDCETPKAGGSGCWEKRGKVGEKGHQKMVW